MASAQQDAQDLPRSPEPVYVLTLSTDDADDQADALTRALRTHASNTAAWSLSETGQSFETLAIALRCPVRPDAACLERIGDYLHAKHYVWGTMSKTPSGVAVNLHAWNRDSPPGRSTATFPSIGNADDPRVQFTAADLFDRLWIPRSDGTIIVHAGTGEGTLTVDGAPRASIVAGTASVDVPPGVHTLSVQVPGFRDASLVVSVATADERDVDFALSAATETAATPASPTRTRTIVGYSALAAGAVLIAAAGAQGLRWLNDTQRSADDRTQVPTTVTDVCAMPVNGAAMDACQKTNDARTAAAFGWVFTALGAAAAGAGAWLLVTTPASSSDHHVAIDVVPVITPREQSLELRARF